VRTLEQRLKFDHGLPVGISLIAFTHVGNLKKALVEIGPRGKVWAFTEPEVGDMYASWFEVKGDKTISGKGRLLTWPAKDVDFMAQFVGTPLATIPLTLPTKDI